MPAQPPSAVEEGTFRTIVRDIPRLLRHPIWTRREHIGRGQGVLLIPGFGFGDRSLALARTWFAARGYRAIGSRTGLNVGCTTTMVERLERTLERHAEATGRKVIVFGQSRGGWLGRIVAVRRPDLVGGLVMLASAVLNPLGGRAKFLAVARVIARLGTAGIPGVVDQDCFTGPCYRTNREHLDSPLPGDIPAVSVFSRHDKIAPWELCRDPSAEHVEVRSTHTGMALDPDVYAALLPRLTSWAS
ncbi:alpha/beta hydrolase [Thermocrispum agreste]|uniref:alpha/beta hydrolase n=1 Tax=Thermocrispum agreste TaxID=37925 RepID=UPI0004053D01|nr:alpha/beta hydrolase [Thermocrispum agreste]